MKCQAEIIGYATKRLLVCLARPRSFACERAGTMSLDPMSSKARFGKRVQIYPGIYVRSTSLILPIA